MKKNVVNFLIIITVILSALFFLACEEEQNNSGSSSNKKDSGSVEEASIEKDQANDSTIKIVRGQNYPPYHYINEEGELVGICVEVVKNIADQLNIEVEFEQNSWTRCLHLVKIGEADAMMNLFKTDERTEFMFFDDNVLEYEINALWTKKDKNINYNGDIVESVNDKSIGMIKNYSYGELFDSVKNKLNIDETSMNEEVLVKKLVSDRLDLIIGNQLVIKWHADKTNTLKEIKMLEPVISKGALYIGFSKASSDLESLSESFSSTLRKFKKTTEYNDILEKYYK